MEEVKYFKTIDEVLETVKFSNFERGKLIFRGQVNSEWLITPTLFRKYSDPYETKLYEGGILNLSFLNIKLPYVESNSPIDLFITAQHFGIHTRLTDWTYDILVALFFACFDKLNENVNKNGVIFLIDKQSFQYFNTNDIRFEKYKKPLLTENIAFYSEEFSIQDVYIVEPVTKNPRMRVQDALFLFFPYIVEEDMKTLISLETYRKIRQKELDKYNLTNKEKINNFLFAKILIDKDSKLTILKELDEKYHISFKSLFVDTIYSRQSEKIYENLKRHIENQIINYKKDKKR